MSIRVLSVLIIYYLKPVSAVFCITTQPIPMHYSVSQPFRAVPLRATAILLVVASVLPWLVHLIPPHQGTPMGAVLLPLFVVPLVALLRYSPSVGLIVATAGPVLSFLVTGLPQGPMLILLTIELIVFTLVAGQLLRASTLGWVAAPLAFLFTKTVSLIVLTLLPFLSQIEPLNYFFTSISVALPGILLLGLINVLGLLYRPGRPDGQ